MKNKDLIKLLSECNPEAEVGYEYKTILIVHPDLSGEYIDLSGEDKIDKDRITDTGVFVLLGTYKDRSGRIITEVSGVFSTREHAERMGQWLLDCGTFEKQDGGDGEKYIAYHINNNLIIGD